jgi:hypothetical protein
MQLIELRGPVWKLDETMAEKCLIGLPATTIIATGQLGTGVTAQEAFPGTDACRRDRLCQLRID